MCVWLSVGGRHLTPLAHPSAILAFHNSANPYRVATVMKGHFPRVHYYFCSQLGNLSVSFYEGFGLLPGDALTFAPPPLPCSHSPPHQAPTLSRARATPSCRTRRSARARGRRRPRTSSSAITQAATRASFASSRLTTGYTSTTATPRRPQPRPCPSRWSRRAPWAPWPSWWAPRPRRWSWVSR